MNVASRSLALLVAALLSALLMTACSTGSSALDEGDSAGNSSLAPSSPEPSDPEPSDPGGATAGTSACDEVVAGIDAFNLSDFDETVASFERALPLAEAEDAAAGTQASADLLEAVQYYAALPAEDYLNASATSPDFAKYKAITLGQCASDQPPGGDDGGGVLA